MIKRLLLCFICILLVAVPCTASAIVDSASRILDADYLLTTSEYFSLLTKINSVSEKYNCDIIVVTIPSLDGYTVEEYSDALYEYAEYGMGETRDGFMLLISTEERDWALTTYGNADAKFTNSKISYVRDNIKPYLSDDEFYEAFDAFIDSCEYVLANHGKVTFKPLWIVVALGIGIIIAFIAVLIMKSSLKSVRFQPAANNYLKDGSLSLNLQRDIFLYSTITRRAKPQQNPSSSGAGSPGARQSGKF